MMMKYTVIFLCVIISELCRSVPVKYYASKYDHIDVEAILNNRRMVNYYSQCLLDKGPCPPEGVEFKRILPEALQTTCARCSEKQQTVTYRVIKRLKKEFPKVWAQLSELWDPNDIYVEKFESTFKKKYLTAYPTNNNLDTTSSETLENSIVTQSSSTLPSTQGSSTTTIVPDTISSSSVATNITSSSTISSITLHKSYSNNTLSITMSSTNTVRPTRPTTTIRDRVGANIEATVSLAGDFVGGLVRGFGAIGTRVVETSAEIAGVVLKNLARPLQV